MPKKIVFQKQFPIYAFLFSIFPVLSLFVVNIHETIFKVVLRPALASLLLCMIIFFISVFLFKNISKAGLFTLLVEFLFFSYGHVYQLLEQSSGLGIFLGHHRALIPIYLLILIIGFFVIKKIKLNFEITNYLNILVVILILFPVIQIVKSSIITSININNSSVKNDISSTPEEMSTLQANALNSAKPDVYYIILDSYTREDVLITDYSFDNSDFLSSLQSLGFYVARCSNSNYAHTRSSLTSSLNMKYLQEMDTSLTPEKTDRSLVDGLLLNNTVIKEFKKFGYTIETIQSFIGFLNFNETDVYYKLPNEFFLTMPFQPFEVLFLKTTFGKVATELHIPAIDNFIQKAFYPWYDFVRSQEFILNKLPDIIEDPSPKFVFVHVYIPHHPFIFNPDGTYTMDDAFYREAYNYPINDDLFRIGYLNQIQFVNSRILSFVNKAIKSSAFQPIIIIQGDHGQKWDQRMKILNAYYFPSRGYEELYSTISPVNSFRVLFNQYFHEEFPLEKDISFLSSAQTPYDYQIIQDDSLNCVGK
jgi:hypothetical protein